MCVRVEISVYQVFFNGGQLVARNVADGLGKLHIVVFSAHISADAVILGKAEDEFHAGRPLRQQPELIAVIKERAVSLSFFLRPLLVSA